VVKTKPDSRLLLVTIVLSMTLLACSDSEDSGASGRWYTEAQINAGVETFRENCAECHGDRAQGLVENWRIKDIDGFFPPPPLDGSAHAWHHSQSVLLQVIDNGGEALGGKMPAFANVLSHSDKLAAIAYFQSLWSDEIFQQWNQMGGTN
jgi:mono/diheme cytochrome c family protein